MPSRRRNANNALTYYLNGRKAKDLEGLTDIAGNVLSAFDTAVQRAMVGAKRRALPATKRAIRENFGIKASALSDRYRVVSGARGRVARNRSELLTIWASTRKIPLLEFQGRWGGPNSKGAVASILKGKSKTYEGAFRTTIQGRDAIRVRQWDSGTGKRHGRGPVRMLYGPSAFEMLVPLNSADSASQSSRDGVMQEISDYYRGELHRQFKLKGVR